MQDPFYTPHSRHTFTDKQDVIGINGLKIAAESPRAGVYLIVDEEHREVFITGHSEYEADTLSFEYFRDLGKGLPINVPEHYFPDDDPSKKPVSVWKKHSEQLFENWIIYYVKRMIVHENLCGSCGNNTCQRRSLTGDVAFFYFSLR